MSSFRSTRLALFILMIIAMSACGDGRKDEPERSSEDRATPPPLNLPTTTAGPPQPTSSSDATERPTPNGVENPQPTLPAVNPSSVLNAGEIDDNDAWVDYQAYKDSFLLKNSDLVHDVDISERHAISVTDADGLPVLGARVMVYGSQELITESQTDSSGTARFFASAWTETGEHQSLRVVVQRDQAAVQFALSPGQSTEWQVELDFAPQNERVALDVVFLLDATGSMSDEIEQLQDNILAISSRIADLPSETDVRYGLVTYRDRGDDYVTRKHDFVADVGEFQVTLNGVVAMDGGDAPEALNEALHIAVQDMSWRNNAIKLIFLVADAEPHLDYEDDYDYVYEMIAASWNGIKIHPIASSGLWPTGEFIFRQIAQYTGGHFLFLTYQSGTSGAAGSERTDLEAGDSSSFTVAQLDDLVLRLIRDEIAALDEPMVGIGIDPNSSTTNAIPPNTMPEKLSLQTSTSAGRRSYTVVELGMASDELTVNEKLDRAIMALVGIVAVIGGVPLVAMLIGLRNRRRYGKRKRKNEEVWSGSWE